MKYILHVLIALFLISSCQTSNSVVSKFGIQKRKYTKGWFVNKNKFSSSSTHKTVPKHIVNNTTLEESDYEINSINKKEDFKVIRKIAIKSQKYTKVKIQNNKEEKVFKQKNKFNFPKKNELEVPIRTFFEKKHKQYTDEDKPKEYEDVNWFMKILALIPGVALVSGLLMGAIILGILFESMAIFLVISSLITPVMIGISFQFSEYLPLGDEYWNDVFVISGWILTLFVLALLVVFFVMMTGPELIAFLLGLGLTILIAFLLALFIWWLAEEIGIFR